MDLLVILNLIVTICYYAIAVFFAYATIRNFIKTKDVQRAITYGIILIPFILRILRLK